jgi:hypothetical protein
MAVKHALNVTQPDDPAAVVKSSNWNADHVGVALPPQWTYGGHGDVTATTDDPTKTPLTLEGVSGQSTFIFAVRDEYGNLVHDIDQDGISDFIHIAVQTPPDTGGGPGSGSVTIESGGRVRIVPGTGNDGLTIFNAAAAQNILTIRHSGFGDLLEISPDLDTDVPILIVQAVATSVDQFQVWDNAFSNRLFRVLAGGAIATSATFAPADGDIDTGQVALWFDDTNGASALKIKGKSADGTVVTATIPLT